MKKFKIENIFAGKGEVFQRGESFFCSSYRKEKIIGDVFVSHLGLEGDNQSNKLYHGGAEQALCVFCKNEYKFLEEKYDLKLKECSFGENISLLDVWDRDICIGDTFKCGEALFEVSLPRGPCYKIDIVLGIKNLSSKLIKECKTGFYLRVLKEGHINKDFTFELIERKNPNYSVEFANQCFVSPKENKDNIHKLLECKELGAEFKKMLKKKL